MTQSTGITTEQFQKWFGNGDNFSFEVFEKNKIENFDIDIQKAEDAYKDRIQLQPLTQEILDKGFIYANRAGWTDMEPFEIVSISPSGKTATIRPMDAKLIQPATCLGVGGFSAHFDNWSQKWEITSNPEYPTRKIRLTKKGWASKGTKFRLNTRPVKFYDYNF